MTSKAVKQMSLDFIIQNFHNQLNFFKKNMEYYIDSRLKDYLKTNMYRYEIDYCYDEVVKLGMAIRGLCVIYQKDKSSAKYIEPLLKEFHLFDDYWQMRKKDEKGNFIDGSSEFHKLIQKRKDMMNFDKKVSRILNEEQFDECWNERFNVENHKNPSTN